MLVTQSLQHPARCRQFLCSKPKSRVLVEQDFRLILLSTDVSTQIEDAFLDFDSRHRNQHDENYGTDKSKEHDAIRTEEKAERLPFKIGCQPVVPVSQVSS